MAMRFLVFIYGSLKRGFRHADVIAAAEHLGEASAEPFVLVRYGQYPAMVPARRGIVHGELVLVDAVKLAELDRFEDCPRLYQRQRVRLTDGTVAFAYTISRTAALHLPRLPEGVWRECGYAPATLLTSGR